MLQYSSPPQPLLNSFFKYVQDVKCTCNFEIVVWAKGLQVYSLFSHVFLIEGLLTEDAYLAVITSQNLQTPFTFDSFWANLLTFKTIT